MHMKAIITVWFFALFLPFWLTWAAYEIGAAIEQAIAARVAKGGRDGR